MSCGGSDGLCLLTSAAEDSRRERGSEDSSAHSLNPQSSPTARLSARPSFFTISTPVDLNRNGEEKTGLKEGYGGREGGDKVAVLYANVSPLHKPYCTTDRERGERRGGGLCIGLVKGGREAIQGPPLSQCGKKPYPSPAASRSVAVVEP